MTLDANGLTVPRAADFLDLIRNDFETATGLTIDWSRDTFLGNISVVMADRLGELSQLLLAIYGARSPNNAFGVQLDDLGALFDLPREPATFSTVTLTLTGTVGAIIPSGTILAGGGTDGLARWVTTENVTIGAGGTASTIAQGQELGRVTANVGTVTLIVTPRAGLASVTNPSAAVAGVDVESDEAYRARIASDKQGPNAGTAPAIRRQVLAIGDVQQALVIENPSNATTTVLGVSLPPKSGSVIVYPVQDTTAKQEALARVLYESGFSAGIEPIGSVSATVTGDDGVAKIVKWSTAVEVTVDVVMVVVVATGYTLAGITPALEAAIAARSESLRIGQRVRRNTVLCDLLGVEGVDDITTLTLDGSASDYVTGALEIATLDPTSITE
jgi:uncharacterized phage protein gp47/JayE